MDGRFLQGRNRHAVGVELLTVLQALEQDGWLIFGWHHMHLAKRKWLRHPRKLSECDYYQRVLKNWLEKERIVEPLKINRGGSVKYRGAWSGEAPIESIFFQLWLAKGAELCLVAYGEHKVSNDVLEKVLGGANFTIVFIENWLDAISKILSKDEGG